ncbi:MAG TPA: SDR family oxidoreductase, partial [Thermoanaerobaculia bacterium]|nr:SDR family oxidoreductase [Thermoanaerobaculia bacterium]
FDAEARGTVRGSGVGIVVLKRLADALAQGDTIRAIIRGSAVNNDGSGKAGYTAPSVAGQDEVITMALAAAGVDPATIDYVEAHGTGTVLGDPIEVQALARAFRRGGPRERSCALGSVKTNLGHLDTAAGVTGLIKATLALQHGLLPPSLGFSQPNPHIDFAAGPFHVQTELADWPRGASPRRAGVSSFGIGGTNAHAVLEEPPAALAAESTLPWHLFVLSARTPAALATKQAELADHFSHHPEIHAADASYTLQLGRRAFPSRCIVVGRDTVDAAAMLRGGAPERLVSRTAPETAPPVVFLFPGQGSQRPGMGAGLYRAEPVFRREIDRCCEILLSDLGFDLRELLLAPAGSEEAARRLAATEVTQPALFVIEHALAQLWMEWGCRPQALIGHSIGEYVAACLAGVFSLEDALRLVVARGRLVGSLPPGAMLAVSLPEPDAARRAEEHGLAVAAVNAPGSIVLSGPFSVVEQLAGRLAAEGIEHRPLRTSHAFHSAALEPILDSFREEVARRELRPPLLPWISNLSGTWIRPEEATDPGYWARHLRETVRFAAGVEELSRVPGRVYLEVGPGRALSSLVRRRLGRSEEGTVVTSLPQTGEPEDDVRQICEALGLLWLAGVEIDWPAIHAAEKRRRVPLPTYPFERRRYWVEPRLAPQAAPPAQTAGRPDSDGGFYIPLWRQSPVPPLSTVGAGSRPWLLVQDHHGIGEALQQRLRIARVPTVLVTVGGTFRELGRNGFEIDLGDAENWVRLLETLSAREELPETVVHLAGIEGNGDSLGAEQAHVLAFDSLLYLAQALGSLARPEPLLLSMVTTHLQAVTGEERIVPEKAPLLGAFTMLAHKYPNLRCRTVDLPPVAGSGSAEALGSLLWTELGSNHSETVVAYRGGRRWVRHFEPLPEVAAAPSRLREGGVYLITGGEGRIGLALAERLARRVSARLALVDRSVDAARLREIEAAGGETLLLQADIADPQQTRRAVTEVREHWGHIDGVVHAAGTRLNDLEHLETGQRADAAFAPKLAGARNLAAALADDPPDFLLLCSSLSDSAGAGPANDATTAFFDAYAQAGGLSPRTFTLSVSWDGWLEGADTFDRLLSTAVTSPQVVVSVRTPDPLPASSAHRTGERPQQQAERPARGHEVHPRSDNAVYSEPTSGPEALLASLWAQMLGFDRIGAHDNFFDLGGDSLLALRLMTQIDHVFGVKLPISALLEAPTVERLAALLHRREDPTRRSPLVRLHPGGAGRPLFVLPPVGGDVFAYVDLAHRLGADRSVYGLQTVIPSNPVGQNGQQPTMEELGVQYLTAVREVQAEGPWLLAGWSVGAVVAYEMAQQIERSGGTVALLAMLDPFAPPGGRSEGSKDSILLKAFAAMGELMGLQVGPELIRLVQETVAGLDMDTGFDRMAELAQAEGMLPMDVDPSWMRERFNLYSRNMMAMESYLPLPYGGPVTLFRAGASLAPGATDLTLGWGALAH